MNYTTKPQEAEPIDNKPSTDLLVAEQPYGEPIKTNANMKTPNTLIIYIKTRIPNYYKINFEPSMLVPSSKSPKVFFDPLVKYLSGPVQHIHADAAHNAVLTQFFEQHKFDSMINRILSTTIGSMQKVNDLHSATRDGIIDKNIQITLDTLFAPNNLFYINKLPYTIVGTKWNKSSWQIDSKPINDLVSTYQPHNINEPFQEADNELDDIPESLRAGNVAATKLNQTEMMNNVAQGINKPPTSPITTPNETKPKDSFVPWVDIKQNTTNVDANNLQKLFSDYLRNISPIEQTEGYDIAKGPLIFSLFITKEQLVEYINKTKNTVLLKLFNNYIEQQKTLNNLNNDFKAISNQIATNIPVFQENYTELDNLIKSMVPTEEPGVANTMNNKQDGGAPTTQNNNRQDRNKLIANLLNSKDEFVQLIYNGAKIVVDTYTAQTAYFISLELLLKQLQIEYTHIISNNSSPHIANLCFEFDINMAQSLSNTSTITSNRNKINKYTALYRRNYKLFNNVYTNKILPVVNHSNSTPNYAEEFERYAKNPFMMDIEQDQFQLYIYQIILIILLPRTF